MLISDVSLSHTYRHLNNPSSTQEVILAKEGGSRNTNFFLFVYKEENGKMEGY